MSVLKVKSNLDEFSPGNKLIYEMVKEVANIEPEINIYSDAVSKENVVSFEVESDDTDFLQMVSKSLNKHRYIPIKHHEEVKSSDFNLSIISTNPIEIEMMADINQNYLQDQVSILTQLLGKSYSEIAQLTEKVDSIHEYMEKSGLFKYKPVLDYIIEELDNKEILDKSLVDKYVQAPYMN